MRGAKGRNGLPIVRLIFLGVVLIALFFGYRGVQNHHNTGAAASPTQSSAVTVKPQSLSISNSSGATTEPQIPASQGHLVQPDSELGKTLETFLTRYHPDQSAVVVVDGSTNRILAWGETQNRQLNVHKAQLLVSGNNPIASLSKIVTAVSVFENKHLNAEAELPVRGQFHTLYKPQLLDQPSGQSVSIKEAFALSDNPAFGILGLRIGGQKLRQTADGLWFNKTFAGGIPSPGRLTPPDTGYALAERSSGFHEENTSSPLHMAALVRALFYRVPLQIPFNEALDPNLGLPTARTPYLGDKLNDNTYAEMLKLFEQTIISGTAAKNYHKYLRSAYKERLIMGGKTGSLGNGTPGKPRREWFVGFAADRTDNRKCIIFCILQVHDKIRSLPATALAELLINNWADTHLSPTKR